MLKTPPPLPGKHQDSRVSIYGILHVSEIPHRSSWLWVIPHVSKAPVSQINYHDNHLDKTLLSGCSSNFSDEKKQVISVDFIVSLKQKMPNKKICPICRVVMFLKWRKQAMMSLQGMAENRSWSELNLLRHLQKP